MKRTSLYLAVALLFTACSDNQQKKAEQLLEEARSHYAQGQLDEARADIDSLRKTYPDLIEIRKAALKLHQDVELKRAQEEFMQTDSLLQIVQKEYDDMQAKVEEDKAALKATAEELTLLTMKRIERDSIRTQFETLGAKIRYIHMKQKE